MSAFAIIRNCPGDRLATTSDPTVLHLARALKDTCVHLRNRADELDQTLAAGAEVNVTEVRLTLAELQKTVTWICELSDLVACLPPAQVIHCPE